MNAIKFYAVAIPSGAFMALGYVAGLIAHRIADGWNAARVHLDQADDWCIARMKASTKESGNG